MAIADQRSRNERHIEMFELYTKAVQDADTDTLRQLCTPDFCVFEPDFFDEPIRGLDDWCTEIAGAGQGGATFEVVGIQPVADALVVDLRYTPPEGGDPENWKLVYCFLDGKISRQDAQRIS